MKNLLALIFAALLLAACVSTPETVEEPATSPADQSATPGA